MSQQTLGELIGKDRTTVVAIVDGFEGEGLVERRRNPADRRAYALEVTRRGTDWLERARPVLYRAEDEPARGPRARRARPFLSVSSSGCCSAPATHAESPVPMPGPQGFAAVFAGGFVGAIARLGLVEAMPHGALEWPWPTFLANLAGAFALGYFGDAAAGATAASAYRRPLLGTGFAAH